MKKIALMIGAAMISAVAAAAAYAVELRPEIVISGDQVLLGDLFEGLTPQQAATPVAVAPAPGSVVTLGAGWAERVARAYGIAWNGDGASGITIRRQTGPAELPPSAPAAGGDLPQAAPGSEPLPPAASGPDAGLEAPADTRVEIPVLVRNVRQDETIGAADIGWIEVGTTQTGVNVVMDAGELVGMSPRRTLAANTPIRTHDLRLPIEVKRGSTVLMVFESGPLMITARGRALDDGARGQAIRVINIDSNRTVEAAVTGPETVSVRIGSGLASTR